MKQIVCILLCVALMGTCAVAENYNEFVEKYALAGRRMWTATDWESVIIPWGVWEIGTDIPAGRWKLEAASEITSEIASGPTLNDGGAELSLSKAYVSEQLVSINNPAYDAWDTSEIELELKKSFFLQVKYGAVRLTPLEKKSSYRFPVEKSASYENMSYTELMEERKKIQESFQKTDGWMEFSLDIERHTVAEGENIRWHIEAMGDEKAIVEIEYQGKELVWASLRNSESTKYDPSNENDAINVTLSVGATVEVQRGQIIMTPYLGQKDLVFE